VDKFSLVPKKKKREKRSVFGHWRWYIKHDAIESAHVLAGFSEIPTTGLIYEKTKLASRGVMLFKY
jgi:hypothetical protein